MLKKVWEHKCFAFLGRKARHAVQELEWHCTFLPPLRYSDMAPSWCAKQPGITEELRALRTVKLKAWKLGQPLFCLFLIASSLASISLQSQLLPHTDKSPLRWLRCGHRLLFIAALLSSSTRVVAPALLLLLWSILLLISFAISFSAAGECLPAVGIHLDWAPAPIFPSSATT